MEHYTFFLVCDMDNHQTFIGLSPLQIHFQRTHHQPTFEQKNWKNKEESSSSSKE